MKRSILILVSVIIIGAALYLWSQSTAPQSKLSSESSVPKEAAWKTYVNAKYGFQFQYPTSLAISSIDPNTGKHIVIDLTLIENPTPKTALFQLELKGGQDDVFSLDVDTKEVGSSTQMSSVNIGGQQYKQGKFYGEDCGYNLIYVPIKNYWISAATERYGVCGYGKEGNDLGNKILTTLRTYP